MYVYLVIYLYVHILYFFKCLLYYTQLKKKKEFCLANFFHKLSKMAFIRYERNEVL